MKRATIVLCGGRSRRMGLDKGTLPFGPELMLQRVVRLTLEAVDKVVVVAAAEQRLPELPLGVLRIADRRAGRGPLEGLAAGITALQGSAEAVYATSCDVPLLQPALIARLFDLLTDDLQIVVPRDGRFHHPLAAVYRCDILPQIEQLLADDRLRPVYLFDQARTLEVPVDELRSVDPDLSTLENLNRPEDYLAAVERAGYQVSEEIRRGLGVEIE